MRAWATVLWIGLGAAAVAGVSRDTRNGLKAGLPETRADAVRAALREGGAEAVPLVLPLAAADKDGGVRDRAFVELARAKQDGVDRALLAGLTARAAPTRAVAAELLGDRRTAIAAAPLAAALDDADLEVRRAATWAAGQVKASEARDALARSITDEDDLLLRSLAVESFSRVGGEGTAARLAVWAADGPPSVRGAAIRSLRYHDRDEAARQVAVALEVAKDDPRGGPLVFAALETAGLLRRAETIPGLLALLDHPRGRVVDQAFRVVREVSGMELPDDPTAWREWWEHYGEGFEVKRESERPSARGASASRVRFYGAPIVSDRVVFVIDESGSMRDAGPDGAPKIDGARAALDEALAAMEKSAKFNVLGFGDAPRSFADGLVPATEKNVKGARRFLKGAGARGRTNVFDALELALSDPEVDAIVLLSDGAPSVGRYEYFQRIRRHVGWVNRVRGASISCVALAESDSARSFLRELAEETGGTYTER